MAFGGISDLKCKVEVRKGSYSAFLGWRNVMDVSFESKLIHYESDEKCRAVTVERTCMNCVCARSCELLYSGLLYEMVGSNAPITLEEILARECSQSAVAKRDQ